MSQTMRQQLHQAADQCEDARSEANKAMDEYAQARLKLNTLIDTLCPLDQPDGRTSVVVQPAKEVFNARKISLIKLVRTASADYAAAQWHAERKKLGYDPVPQAPTGCMGLAEAKALVEKWIDRDGQL